MLVTEEVTRGTTKYTQKPTPITRFCRQNMTRYKHTQFLQKSKMTISTQMSTNLFIFKLGLGEVLCFPKSQTKIMATLMT